MSEVVQEPLFEPEPGETEIIVGGYKMVWVTGHWRKMPLRRQKKEAEDG